ncbi:MAG: MFS transporter [Verrucomicrobia bacterium]|nr:MFS transporter [Verrucomicrobiota bacterium]
MRKLFSKIPSFSKSGRFSLGFLNATQFLGVINDNVFKFVMAFLMIDALGPSHASTILSATGAIYVIPFLLFSSSAGILADRFSKQKLLVVMKSAEVIVMSLALLAFYTASIWGCYTLLFVLATHSAMFGPSKYGIIPELVPTDSVSKANGVITSFTYLAIIIGTFLASFLTEATDRHFTWIAGFCLLVAVLGLCSSLFVKPTPAQGSKKRINPLFFREIYQTLQYCRTVRHLFLAIIGSAYFLFLGAFTQLNIIPFAIQSLHLSEVAGGYLFLSTALGIALGSLIAGKLSKRRVELGLSCFSGVAIALFLVLITCFSSSLSAVICLLFLIGVFGGIFIVPFDTFIQLNSDNEKRGQTIAAANFLSFSGVLIASISLYFFNQVLDLTSAMGFAVVGAITLSISILFTFRLSDLSLSFFSRIFLQKILRFRREELEVEGILVLEGRTCQTALLLAGSIPSLHFLIPRDHKMLKWYHRFFYSVHIGPEEEHASELIREAKHLIEEGCTPCLLLQNPLPRKEVEKSNSLIHLFTGKAVKISFASIAQDPKTGALSLSINSAS